MPPATARFHRVQDGDLAAMLDRAAGELGRARDLISGKVRDQMPYAISGDVAAAADAASSADSSAALSAATTSR